MVGKLSIATFSGSRKLLLTFNSLLLFGALFFSNVSIVYSIGESSISGIGYGNNGDRFGSFMSCSEHDLVHYFEGSTIHFETSLNDHSAIGQNSGTFTGSWTIDFMVDESQNPMRISGDISELKLENNNYTLVGKETFDNVCNDVGNTITLKGECGENTRIWFDDSKNAKVGSLTPPYGDKSYYLMGSNVDCA